MKKTLENGVRKRYAIYTNKHLDKTDKKEITTDDVFVVWSCKTLQNNKAMLSTTVSDGMYYECTYNGDKKEMYVDAYKKWENFKVEITNEEPRKEILKDFYGNEICKL